jgi:hypothetical protein
MCGAFAALGAGDNAGQSWLMFVKTPEDLRADNPPPDGEARWLPDLTRHTQGRRLATQQI